MKIQKKLFLIVGISVLLFAAGGMFMGYKLGIPVENRLVNAAANDDLPKFRKLAGKCASLDVQEKGMLGYTPLIATTLNEGTNVFFYLVSNGANVDARGRNGETPLMTAVMLGDKNFLKINTLVITGADVRARDAHGSSVLDYAEGAALAGRVITNTIKLLKQRGA